MKISKATIQPKGATMLLNEIRSTFWFVIGLSVVLCALVLS